jgi:hypothetical protein
MNASCHVILSINPLQMPNTSPENTRPKSLLVSPPLRKSKQFFVNAMSGKMLPS